MSFNEDNINRDTAGRFDEKPQSSPEARLPEVRQSPTAAPPGSEATSQAGVVPGSEATSEVTMTGPADPSEMLYRLFVNGNPVYNGARGDSVSHVLQMAATHADMNPGATIVVSGSGTDEDGQPVGKDVSVELHPFSYGRMVGWCEGYALTVEDLDSQGLTLADVDLGFEPYIDTRAEFQLDNVHEVERMLRDADVDFSDVYAATDDDNPDIVNVDVGVYEDFLWDVDPGCEMSEDDREEARAARSAELDEYRHIVEEVFHDQFNAEIADIPDDWDSARLQIRIPIKRSRFTPSLVAEDVYGVMADYVNQTDPGTYNSSYIMTEVWARIARAKAAKEDGR